MCIVKVADWEFLNPNLNIYLVSSLCIYSMLTKLTVTNNPCEVLFINITFLYLLLCGILPYISHPTHTLNIQPIKTSAARAKGSIRSTGLRNLPRPENLWNEGKVEAELGWLGLCREMTNSLVTRMASSVTTKYLQSQITAEHGAERRNFWLYCLNPA